jgi:CRP-like cAMP-binding protein
MEGFSVLFSYFERITNRRLTFDEKAEVASLFKIETFKKKEIVFGAGESNTRHYYIENGLMRMFIINQAGKEFNILFAKEKQWIGDLGTPSVTSYFLEAVEKSVVFSIEDEKFSILSEKFGELSNNIRKSYVFLQKRFVSILSKTAEENYEALAQQDPDLIRRLPQYHISSYLGVTPVFLSKILAKRAKKKD